jgi:hypothetical protein
MENSFQTSFIPKKPISSVGTVSKGPTSLFTVLAIIILVIVAIAAGGLFVYKGYLGRQKESLSVSLLKVRDSFEKETIDELELFNKRTDAAKEILDSHIVLSPVFELIGNLTIPSIQYTKFEHQTSEKGFYVKMSGISRDYRSIALQADVFNSAKGRYFKNVVFSNLIKDKNNYVTFNIEFSVDPNLLSYEKNLLLEEQTQTDPSLLPDNLDNN